MTEYLMRFEYSETGKFENRASLAVVNRNLPSFGKFVHYEQDGKLFILTSKDWLLRKFLYYATLITI